MSRPRQRVLALPGSLRRRSYNRGLLVSAEELAPPGMEVRLYAALASIPLFDEDLEQESSGGPPPVRDLRAAVAAADALLIATPEYNQSIPGVLKNAIDWLSREAPEEVLAGKPVAIAGATAGRWGTRLAQAALRQTLVATGALVLPTPSLFVAGAAGLFDDAGRLADPATRQQLVSLLAALASWIDTVRRRPSGAASTTLGRNPPP